MEEDVVGEAAGEHVEDFGADGELAFPGKLGERDCVRLVVSWMRSGPGPANCHLGREEGVDGKDRDPRGREKITFANTTLVQRGIPINSKIRPDFLAPPPTSECTVCLVQPVSPIQ